MAQPQQTNNPHFSNIQQAPNQAAAQSGQPTNQQGQQQPNVSIPCHSRFDKKPKIIFLETAKVNHYLSILPLTEVSTGTSLYIKSERIS